MAFPAQFVDIQNAVTAKARLASTDLSKVKDWINQTYAQVCVETEAVQTFATMTVTAGSSSYTLPSAVVRIKQITMQPVGGNYGPPLKQVSLEQILEWRQTQAAVANTNGSSTHYAVLGVNDIELYPTPANADTMLVYYVALPTALSADSDVSILQEPWSSKILEYGALVQAGEFKGDPMTTDWMQMYENWIQRYRSQLNRKRGAMTTQFRVVGRRMDVPHDPGVDTGR